MIKNLTYYFTVTYFAYENQIFVCMLTEFLSIYYSLKILFFSTYMFKNYKLTCISPDASKISLVHKMPLYPVFKTQWF